MFSVNDFRNVRNVSGMISKVFEQDKLFLDKRIDLFSVYFRMFWVIYFCFSQKRNQDDKVPFVFCNYFSVYFLISRPEKYSVMISKVNEK